MTRARPAGQLRLAVEPDARLPGDLGERVEVGHEEHVRLGDPREALDAGAVEPLPVLDRLLQLVHRHLDRLHLADDVGELEADEPQVAVLRQLEGSSERRGGHAETSWRGDWLGRQPTGRPSAMTDTTTRLARNQLCDLHKTALGLVDAAQEACRASSGRRGSIPSSADARRSRYRTVFRCTPRLRAAGAIRPLARATARSVSRIGSPVLGGRRAGVRGPAAGADGRRSSARRVTAKASRATASTAANGRSSKSHAEADGPTERSRIHRPSRVRRGSAGREERSPRRRACAAAKRVASAVPAGRGLRAANAPSTRHGDAPPQARGENARGRAGLRIGQRCLRTRKSHLAGDGREQLTLAVEVCGDGIDGAGRCPDARDHRQWAAARIERPFAIGDDPDCRGLEAGGVRSRAPGRRCRPRPPRRRRPGAVRASSAAGAAERHGCARRRAAGRPRSSGEPETRRASGSTARQASRTLVIRLPRAALTRRSSSAAGWSNRSPRRRTCRPSAVGRTLTRRRGHQNATASAMHRSAAPAKRIAKSRIAAGKERHPGIEAIEAHDEIPDARPPRPD